MKFLLEKPWLVLLGILVLVGAVGHRFLFLVHDNSPERLFAADRQSTETYDAMKKTFGADEMVLIQLRNASHRKAKDLKAVAELARIVRKLPGVDLVFSISNVWDTDFDEALEDVDAETVTKVVNEVKILKLYRELGIVREDIPALSVVAFISMKGPDSRSKFNTQLIEVTARFQKRGYDSIVAGLTPTNAAIEREGQKVQKIFMPLVAALIVLIGLLTFRSFLAVIAMCAPVGGAIMVGLGGLELFNEPLSLMTTVLPQLIMVIGFAGAIHICSRYAFWNNSLSPAEAVKKAWQEKLVPTTFAFGTTALGFGSLGLSDAYPVRVLGISAALTLLVTLGFVMFGTPALLLLLRPRIYNPATKTRWMARTARVALRHRYAVFILAGLAVVFIATGMTKLNTSITAIELLGDRVPEKRAFVKLESENQGLGNIDIWLKIKARTFKEHLAVARRIDAMHADLKKIKLVTAVSSVVDAWKIYQMRVTAQRSFAIPQNYIPVPGEPGTKRFARNLAMWWHPEKGFKVVVVTKTAKEEVIDAQCKEVQKVFAKHFPGVKAELSGHYLMLLGTPGALMRTLGTSLTITVGVIGFLFLLAFKRIWITTSAMLVNLLPIGIVIGYTGWSNIPMDIATVMTGSIAFGITVDNTFHYLYHQRKTGSVIQAATIAGKGIVATSIIVAGGFAVLGLSGFNPVMRFGLLAALAVMTALATNSFLLPALVGSAADLADTSALESLPLTTPVQAVSESQPID